MVSYIPVADGKIAITEREREEYTHLPKNESVYGALMGQSVKREITGTDIAGQYLQMHAEMLKKFTFPQFVSHMQQLEQEKT